MSSPFHRVAIDLIGPIIPMSEKGHRYILTLVDYATRYPEAIALKGIDTETVAEALIEIFSRIGFPVEIPSDQGSQFTSDLMKEITKLLSIKHLFTTLYDPKCNGLCERMNGVLKCMIKKMCQEQPNNCDRYLLFAYRVVPQASTGFSPFELLYGRTVRGLLQLLKDLWLNEKENDEVKVTYQYILDLRNGLEKTCKLAQDSLKVAQWVYKHHYDKKSKERIFKVGDKVLVLLPTDHNKLLLRWKGPFNVIEDMGCNDYRIETDDKSRIHHANLLKGYVTRNTNSSPVQANLIVLETGDQLGNIVHDKEIFAVADVDDTVETWRELVISNDLTATQKQELDNLLEEYRDIFTSKP